MTDGAGDREQDVGRRHRRAVPEPEPILERYREAMRREVADLLDELRPDAGQLTIGGAVDRPTLERRRALWDLAVKLGRELGEAPPPPPTPLAPVAPPARRQAPRLTAGARRQLGG